MMLSVVATSVRRPRMLVARGMTVLEVLMSLIVLQTGLLIAYQALTIGTEFGGNARNTTVATLVAQERLEHTLHVVVPGVVQGTYTADENGVVQEPAQLAAVPIPAGISEPELQDMSWQATIQRAEADGLYDVSVTVRYATKRRWRTVTLSTRAYEPGGGV